MVRSIIAYFSASETSSTTYTFWLHKKISYIFQELSVVQLPEGINRIIQSSVRSPDRSVQFVDRVMDKMGTSNNVVL